MVNPQARTAQNTPASSVPRPHVKHKRQSRADSGQKANRLLSRPHATQAGPSDDTLRRLHRSAIHVARQCEARLLPVAHIRPLKDWAGSSRAEDSVKRRHAGDMEQAQQGKAGSTPPSLKSSSVDHTRRAKKSQQLDGSCRQ